jgi:hypothetical protein
MSSSPSKNRRIAASTNRLEMGEFTQVFGRISPSARRLASSATPIAIQTKPFAKPGPLALELHILQRVKRKND